MYISSVRVKNFRSITDANIKLNKLNIFCGPNSSGKSNILRAIKVAFDDMPQEKHEIEKFVRSNLTLSKLNSSASIQIEVTLSNVPSAVALLAEEPKAKSLVYKFKATKGGALTRTLGKKEIDEDSFKRLIDRFTVVYIPTIRDLENNGLKPFQDLFRRAIQSSHGGREMKGHLAEVRKTLARKASILLAEQKEFAKSVLGARSIELRAEKISLDSIYDDIALQVKGVSKEEMPLENVGTGHQSMVILNLYKQYGTSSPGHVVYLFEEPDAHLHPPIIRSVGKELGAISENSQVIVSTHSPVLIGYVGLDKVTHLKHTEKFGTEINVVDLSTERQAVFSHCLFKYGLRITEAMFTKLVVLVEGQTDAVVIGRLIERKSGRTADQLDILLVPAGGKENVAELARIMNALSVDWVAILDYDAAHTTTTTPITVPRTHSDDVVKWVDNLGEVCKKIDSTTKRGRNVEKHLKLVLDELRDGHPTVEFYDNSVLKQLLEEARDMSATRASSLKMALKNNKIRLIREMLSKNGVWLLRPDLENLLMGNSGGNAHVIDPILRKKNSFNAAIASPTYRQAMLNSLHSLAANAEALVAIVDAVDDVGGFNMTDLNMSVKSILDMVS